MGLLSSIGKVVKKVWSGVKKVFNKALGFVGKIAASKWGKALMLAAAVFTGGAALAAGFSAAAGTAGGFMAQAVAGSQAFMGALTGAGAASAATGAAGAAGGAAGAAGVTGGVAGAAGAAGAAGTAGVAGAGAAGAGAAGAAGAGAAGAGAAGAGTAGITGASTAGITGAGQAATAAGGAAGGAAGAAGAAGTTSTMGQIGGMLVKGAKAAYNFANTPVGKEIISRGLEGYSQGKQLEAENEREDEKLYGSKKDMKAAGNWGNVGEFEYNQPA